MAKDDVDLIGLFGLSPEEATGLGLDAHPGNERRTPPSASTEADATHDGSAHPPSDAVVDGLPAHAEPALQLVAGLPSSREVSPDDERALLALLDGSSTRAEDGSGYGAGRGLSLADAVARDEYGSLSSQGSGVRGQGSALPLAPSPYPLMPLQAPDAEPDSRPEAVTALESTAPPLDGTARAIDPDLLDAFSEESSELLDGLHVELERLESDAGDHGALLEVRRIMHTLKGGATMCGFEAVAMLAHACENVLDAIADGMAMVDAALLHDLFACAPLLRSALAAAIAGQDIDAPDISALAARFDARALTPQPPLPDDGRGGAVDLTPQPSLSDGERGGATHATPEGCRPQPLPLDFQSKVLTAEEECEPVLPSHFEEEEPEESGEQATPAADIAWSDPDADERIETVVVAPDAAGLLVPPEPFPEPLDDESDAQEPAADAPVIATRPLDLVGVLDAGAPAIQMSRPASGSWLAVPPIGRGAAAAPEPAPRSAGRRGPNSISVDVAKVDAVVAKLAEMAAHRVSSQGMLGRLLETSEDARANVTRLRSLVMQLGNECATIQPEGVKDDDLNLESYNTLNTLILQLQEAVSDQQALVHAVHDTITSHWSLQATETRIDADIHSALMSIRLVPLANMRVRLDSVVRQAAEATGKTVRWQLQGGTVAVEKNVFDRLFEPLMHLLRNAVDHGVESAAARRNAGKPESGVISVNVVQEGSQVVITVSDDGAGIVPNRIAASAVERGLISAEAAGAMSYEQKMSLIFLPGFSTAAALSHISGRGVGMDAVREACLRMGGSIDVTSRPGIGSTFILRLPLSLSVARGLIIRDGGALLALPVTQVVALHLVPAPDVVETPRGRVARIEGQELPVYNLTPLPGASPTSYIQNGEVNVLQVAHEGGAIGLLIEDVVGEEEILIKAPPALLQGVKPLLGAHVLPDGKVVPVVNLPQMLLDLRPAALLMPPKEDVPDHEMTALVVDDSMSMRVALSGTLRSAGFKVLTARDGQEALEILKRDGLPSIVTLDVEMPRMDGLETLFAIRQMGGAQELPVFMMTSRGGTKHRRAAEQLGATRYFTKPYRDSELASAARAACALPISAA